MNYNLELFGNERPYQQILNVDESVFDAYDKKKRIKNADNIMHFFERHVRSAGYGNIAGVDEAGRGPLAGPVVAAIAVLPKDYHIEGLYDSKGISEKMREKVFAEITANADIKWAVGIVGNAEIDRINILQATYKAAFDAYSSLSVRPDFLLNDAMIIPGIKIGQKKIIKGDAKSASIAAASIIAKVTRDRLMNEYDVKYPQYGFSKHKGYGTAEHISNIRLHGYCEIHRMTFKIEL